jgi:hypothetical protein
MLARIGVVAGHAAEIDDAPHSRGPRAPDEGLRGATVGFGEVLAGRDRMHQVVGDLGALEYRREPTGVEHVGLDDLGTGGPR